jgi:hypothetical protein
MSLYCSHIGGFLLKRINTFKIATLSSLETRVLPSLRLRGTVSSNSGDGERRLMSSDLRASVRT